VPQIIPPQPQHIIEPPQVWVPQHVEPSPVSWLNQPSVPVSWLNQQLVQPEPSLPVSWLNQQLPEPVPASWLNPWVQQEPEQVASWINNGQTSFSGSNGAAEAANGSGHAQGVVPPSCINVPKPASWLACVDTDNSSVVSGGGTGR
jgi:hypothetical protein